MKRRIILVSVFAFTILSAFCLLGIAQADSFHDGWLWPTVSSYRQLSRGYYSGHSGIDISIGPNNPVYASKAGTVLMTYTGCKNYSKQYNCSTLCSPNCNVYSGNGTCNWGYGNGVIIKHADGSISMYAHMSSVSVSNGQSVAQNQQIGTSGSTGNSTGAHLHFELASSYTVNGTYYTPNSYDNNPRSADYGITSSNKSGLSTSNGYQYDPNGVEYIFSSDIEPPVISNVRVSNINRDGYTVTCDVSDNVGVTQVRFPTWTIPGNQDDLLWADGTISGNTASFRVNVSDHGNQRDCDYVTHIYAYDAAGNQAVANTDNYSFLQVHVPATNPEVHYTITLDATGGSLNQSSLPVTLNASDYYELSWNLPAREGYAFDGWYTAPSGGTQVYNNQGYCTNEGTYWSNNYYVYQGNITLYAHWHPVPINLGDDFNAYIRHHNSSLYLTNQLDNIAGEAYVGGANQIWHFVRQSNGSYAMFSLLNNGIIDVLALSTEDGANVYAYTGPELINPNQQWYIYYLDGKYCFSPVHTNQQMALDMDDTTHNLQIYTWSLGWYPQEFDIIIKDELVDPIVFNSDYYLEMNPDLAAAFGTDETQLLNHWINEGIAEGREASPVFNVGYYLNHNSDVNDAFGGNHVEAIRHFVRDGVAEGRASHDSFNVNYYRANYLDLQSAFGDNNYEYYLHYVRYGRNEGRVGDRRIAVTLNPMGGAVSPTELTVTDGMPYGTLPEPTKDKSLFDGWYTEADGGTMITEESIVDYEQVKTLYAHWLEPVSILAIPPVNPCMAGHVFTKDELYVEVVYEDGTMFEITDYILEQSGTEGGTQTLTLTYGPISETIEVELVPEPDFILPANLFVIEAEAFRGIDAKVVLVPSSCTSIGARAFADCPNLEYVIVNDLSAIGIAGDALDGTEAEIIERSDHSQG